MQDIRAWLDTVRRRDTNSQLMAISDLTYEAGVRRLESELANANTPKMRADHLAKEIAHHRHEFMRGYVLRFHQEWDGLA